MLSKLCAALLLTVSLASAQYSPGVSTGIPGSGPIFFAPTFDWNAEQFKIQVSGDGKSWVPALPSQSHYSPTTGYMRDPSMGLMKSTGAYYMAHSEGDYCGTITIGTCPAAAFVVTQFQNGLTQAPTLLATVAYPADGSTDIYAPEFFHNSDGSIFVDASGYAYILADTGLGLYWSRSLATSMSVWSTPAKITGTSLPTTAIDPFGVYDGSTYQIYYANTSSGNSYIERWVCTGPTSGCAVSQSGNWTGWGNNLEGPAMLQLPNGTWMAWLDHQGQGEYWSTSANRNTWTSLVNTYSILHHTTPLMATSATIQADIGALVPSSAIGVRTWSGRISTGPTNAGGKDVSLFYPPNAITIIRFTAFAVTSAAGCSTSPILSIADASSGTPISSLLSITFTNGTSSFDTLPTSVQFTATYDGLTLQWSTASAGCSTQPSNIDFLVEYQ